MKEFIIPGIVSVALGILMSIFNQAIGINFCRIGKSIWDKNKEHPIDLVRCMAKDANTMYDETKAPRIVRFLGIVFIIQGVFLVIVGMIR